MRKILKERGFNVEAVARATGIQRSKLYRWDDNAPIKEIWQISEFTHIPFMELAECFRPSPGAIDTTPTGGDEN